MLRSRDRNAHQADHKNNYIRSTIEKNSKQDKVHRKKIENRNRFIYGGLPRIGCCLLMVLFCIGLSYRMTDRVIRHIPKKKSHHRSAKETTAATTQRSNNLQKKKSRRTSLLKNIHNKSIVYKSGQSVHILTKQEKKRQQEHLTHLKQHGNLLAAAKIHQTHQHGPHAPKGHRKYELTESERQGNQIIRLDGDSNRIITSCKEYLGDHIHCKPTLDMTALRSVQEEYEMSESLFLKTIADERKRWSEAYDVGLDTRFMRLRLIEVGHNSNLRTKKVVQNFDKASIAEQTWRYKHILRHVNYMRHNRAKFDDNTGDMKRNLDAIKRDLLAAHVIKNLNELYLMLGKQKHESTIAQIVYKYVRKHDLLEALVERLEKRYSKQQGLVAEYLYPCLAGERSLMKGKGWPNEKKHVVKVINNTNMVNQEELDAVNWMFRKLRQHRLEEQVRLEKEKTSKTCIFSHTNEMSPCFPTHPCSKIKHEVRTRAIIVKCFWHIARPYCEANQKHRHGVVPYQKKKKTKQTEKRKVKGKEQKQKKKQGRAIITSIDGKTIKNEEVKKEVKKKVKTNSKKNGKSNAKTEVKARVKTQEEVKEEEDITKELKEEQLLEKKEDDEEKQEELKEAIKELQKEEELEKEVETIEQELVQEEDDDDDDEEEKDNEEEKEENQQDQPNDPYDAEDAEEYDEACNHVLHDSFVEALTYFESRGLLPELEERDKREKEDKEREEKEGKERRNHIFLPNEKKKEVDKQEEKRLVLLKEEEDRVIALLPPADPKVHSLLNKKSTRRNKLSVLKHKLQQWYAKHHLPEKAQDEIHLNELAKKYLTHEDLLFTRLHTKYHETRD